MVEENGRRRYGFTQNEALVLFREASVVRGPSQAEFAKAAGMPGASSAQPYFPKLEAVGWIERVDPSNPLSPYRLTPAGERRYRELVPEEKRKGPEWPTE